MLTIKRALAIVTIVFLVIGLTACVSLVPGATKATGGGQIVDIDGKQASFGFNAQIRKPFDGIYENGAAVLDAKGQFQFNDKAEGFKVHATVTSVTIYEDGYLDGYWEYEVLENLISFHGTAVVDGEEVAVTVTASDGDADSEPDSIQIEVRDNGGNLIYDLAGEVVNGNIKVH